jgi:hypothetical protein
MSSTRVTTLVHPRSLCVNELESVWWTRRVADLQRWREDHLEGHAFAIVTRGWAEGGLRLVDARIVVVGEEQAAPVALALGAHPMCDIGGLRSASLRHAIVLLWPIADDQHGAIEVLDLRSASGLLTGLGSSSSGERVVGDDVVRFAAGANEVTILHASPGGRFVADFPDDLDGFSGLARTDPRGIPRRPLDAEPTGRMPRPSDCRPIREEVTRVGSVVYRESGRLRRRFAEQPLPAEQVIVPCREDELERGLLLGRYTRCDGANCLGTSDKVSRVHALLLTRRGRTWLIDVGSTNGTEVLALDRGDVLAFLDDQLRLWPLGPGEGFRIGGVEVLLEIRG